MKVCSVCSVCKPEVEFARCHRSRGGFKATCKACVCKKQQFKRKNPDAYQRQMEIKKQYRSDRRLQIMNDAKRTRSHRVTFENEMVSWIKSECAHHGLHVQQWQDSTESDFGIRRVGSTVDLWLPFQLKTTQREAPPFVFHGMEKMYRCDILCVTATRFLYMFHSEFVSSNANSLSGGSNIEIGRRTTSTTNAFNDSSTISIKDFVMYCKSRLSANDQVGLFSEETLRMQCPRHCQAEAFTMMMYRKVHPDQTFDWNSPNDHADAIVDGKRTQFKVCGWNKRVKQATFVGQPWKRFGKTVMAYEVGDVDVFIFSTIHVRLRLYLEWRIPSNVMEETFHALAIKENGKFVHEGKMSLALSVLGSGNENSSLQLKIFGKVPQRNVDLRSSAFLTVVELPDDFAIPECMNGRDPDV